LKEDRGEVLRARIELELQQQHVLKAVTLLASAPGDISFDESVLRLLGLTSSLSSISLLEHEPSLDTSFTQGTNLVKLRRYLQACLTRLPPTDKSQRCMLCTWLCEIFLHQIASIDHVDATKVVKGNKSITDKETGTEIIEQFKDLLRNNKYGLHRRSSGVCSSHDVTKIVVGVI
jgi:hypothetical protein